jgi:hypothetical protein
LPSNDKEEGLMRRMYEVRNRVGLSAMIYIASFINIDSGIQKLKGFRIHRHRNRVEIAYFFKIRKVD